MEKIIFLYLGATSDKKEYIPEDGWVIRDMKLYGDYLAIWLQKSDFLN